MWRYFFMRTLPYFGKINNPDIRVIYFARSSLLNSDFLCLFLLDLAEADRKNAVL
jgi:hypothetical protein